MDEDIIKRFWEASPEELFNRDEVAKVRRCSKAKLEREAWLGTGIPYFMDGNKALYRKRNIIAKIEANEKRRVV